MPRRLIFATILAFIALDVAADDCLTPFGGRDNVIGKKFIEDGNRVTKNIVIINPNNAQIKQSEMNGWYRTIRPNSAVTADYRLDRINFHIDDDNLITDAGCF